MIKTVYIGCLVAAFGLVSSSSIAAEKYEEELEFDLHELDALTLNVSHARVEFSDGDDMAVRAVFTQTLKRGEEQDCLHKLEARQSGTRLYLETRSPRSKWYKSCDVERALYLTVDQSALGELQLKQSHGNFHARAISIAGVELDVSHGNLVLGELLTDKAHVEARHGNISVDRLTAKNLELRGAHGAFDGSELEAADIDARWSHGSVSIAQARANKLVFDQSHARLNLKRYDGEVLKVNGAHGGISADNATASLVEISNSHASIHYSGNSDRLVVRNSHGSTELNEQNSEFQQISGRSSHGSFELMVPAGSVCKLFGIKTDNVNRQVYRQEQNCDGGEVQLSQSHSHASISASRL